jgi:hypothetical protein
MLKYKRSLFIRMTFQAGRVCTGCQTKLFALKAPVRIMAIRAVHRTFENFVVEWFRELTLCFVVAGNAQLGLFFRQHFLIGRRRCVQRMARQTTDIVAPVLATPVIVVFFAT